MKVAVLSESPADEAAVRILVEGILGRQTQPIDPPRSLRIRGWTSILNKTNELSAVLRSLYFYTNAEALVLVVDSNHSPVHQEAHNQPGEANEEREECRLCRLHETVDQISRQLRPVPNRSPSKPKTAIGLAVPAIEAWYRCGLDPHVSEAVWISGQQEGREPYTKNDLKRDVYGTDRPSLELETRRAIEEARRLAENPNLLIKWFPNGFGSLVRDIRDW